MSLKKRTPQKQEPPPSPTCKDDSDGGGADDDDGFWDSSNGGCSHDLADPFLFPQQQKQLRHRRQELLRKESLRLLMKYVVHPVYEFFFARTGPKGCRLAGYIRVVYAMLFLYSRGLLAIELPLLFDPITGVMPYRITQLDIYSEDLSIFQWAPDSRALLYGMYYLGLLNGALLLLGVAWPRLQAVGVYFFLCNLHNHNSALWDKQEDMLRMWSFMLLWLPLDHITLYDGFGGIITPVDEKDFTVASIAARCLPSLTKNDMKSTPLQLRRPKNDRHDHHEIHVEKDALLRDESVAASISTDADGKPKEQSTSWPMWPFRIWQIYVCLVYTGAALCKANSSTWESGVALYYLWYEDGFGRFFPDIVSELFFNRMIAIKLQTWAALVIEAICIVAIWPKSLRWYTFIAVVILHIGIELALIMHIFEYLSVLGWLVFFVYPNDSIDRESPSRRTTMASKAPKTGIVVGGDGANDEDDDEEETNEKTVKTAMTAASWSSPSRRKLIIESVVIATLLYFFVVDALPRRDIVELLPRPFSGLMERFILPTKASRRQIKSVAEWAGIHTGPWTVFRGKPPHSHSRFTAVIQFNDGTNPVLWSHFNPYERNDPYSLYARERYYWSDTYYYYLASGYNGQLDGIPLYATFALHLAKQYSNGKLTVDHTPNGLEILKDPSNRIKSISLMAHQKRGKDPPKTYDWFASLPRGWKYTSECQFVLEVEKFPKSMDIDRLLKYKKNGTFEVQSHCDHFDDIDWKVHREKSYDPNPAESYHG
jgi:hypothetical protein